ncbi:MAG TPA: alanine racemase [Actinomycetota bacterium]|nr:alanine racemase [Actinomycetota bacterium]
MSTAGPVWAEVDLGRIRHNTASMKALVAPAKLMAVVKANGYGHGASEVAIAAVEGGADWLGVARVEEGEVLRRGGVSRPILLLSEPMGKPAARVIELGLTPTIYTTEAAEAFARAGRATGQGYVDVHLKIDTGMHRYGAEPEAAIQLAQKVSEMEGITLIGIWSHLAVGEKRNNAFTSSQLERFMETIDGLEPASLIRHVCNSGGAISSPEGRLDMIRSGICIYGILPSKDLAGVVDLKPAMKLKSRVAFVKKVKSGEGVSYGLRYEAPADTTIVTVPCGYADGLPRAWGEGGVILINGRRYPIAGTITMDHLMADVGNDEIGPGDEVVLLGSQGADEINATEIADAVGTIPYEIVCGISARVPRVYVDSSR